MIPVTVGYNVVEKVSTLPKYLYINFENVDLRNNMFWLQAFYPTIFKIGILRRIKLYVISEDLYNQD